MGRRAAKFVGVFDVGTRNVELYIDGGQNAHFHMQPEKNRQAQITVGTDNKWWQIVGILTHEIVEFVFADMGLRFVPAPDISQDNGNYQFTMNHTQFSEATSRVGLFLSKAIPALRKAVPKRIK